MKPNLPPSPESRVTQMSPEDVQKALDRQGELASSEAKKILKHPTLTPDLPSQGREVSTEELDEAMRHGMSFM